MHRILHFADAHIDMVTQGRHDPQTGLAVRAMDFLRALDTIVDTAIDERVDLVIFAGDAYRDRTPVPTFQREWGRRIKRLSEAGIETILLVGNHDLSPASGRAHALQEFETLAVPHVQVVSQPKFLRPEDLGGLPLQVLALPWAYRSTLMMEVDGGGVYDEELRNSFETRLYNLIKNWLDNTDPSIPVILTAHLSVQGAEYGSERTVNLGSEVVIGGSLLRDPRINYVALGHIHKAQDFNKGKQPPIIYPGSIERVDVGEARDQKYFVVAQVEHEKPTKFEWRKLKGRKFFDYRVVIKTEKDAEEIISALPSAEGLKDSVVRLVIEYPHELGDFIDERQLREYTKDCLEFHLLRRPKQGTRARIPEGITSSDLSALDLLDYYWKAIHIEKDEMEALQKLAAEVLNGPQGEEGD